ncbi:TonB-dependent receptor [bacterium]|nr:TonB-dependent receptor [bacterium]
MRIFVWYFLLIVAIGSFTGSHSFSQSFFILVKDEVTLNPIPDIKVRARIDVEGESEWNTFLTDQQGKVRFPENATQLTFSHPGYDSVSFTAEEIKELRYVIFLPANTFFLEEEVITGGKFKMSKKDIPATIEVIRPQQVALYNPQSSADLLLQTGKVFVQKSQMGGGSPNLRGFEANKVMIVIDGVRMNNAIYRGGHLQNVITIDPNMIERTEVLFGPASVMYGSDALGGVMHFYTRRPALSLGSKPIIKGNAFARYSSANTEKTGHLDLNIGFKKWGFLTSITATDYNDLLAGNKRRDDYPNYGKRFEYVDRINGRDSVIQNENVNLQRFSGYSQLDVMQKVFFLQSDKVKHDLNFQVSTSTDVPRYDRLTERRGGDLRRAAWYYGPQQRIFAAYKLNLFGEPASFYDKLTLTTAFQRLGESRHTRGFNSAWRNDRTERVDVYSANLDAIKQLGNHQLSYGVEATQNVVRSQAGAVNIETEAPRLLSTRYPDGGSEMRFLAGYVGDRWRASEKWKLNAGVRFTGIYLAARFDNKDFFPFLEDEVSQNSSAFSANLGSIFTPVKGTRIAMLASNGFRAPNVDDIGKTFDSNPGNVIVPNPNLKPEYTYNIEMTVSQVIADNLHLEISGWNTWYVDALVVRNFRLGDSDSIMYEGVRSQIQASVNARKAVLRGVSASMQYKFWEHFRLTSSLTFTHGQDLSASVPLDHIPPLFGKTALSYRAKGIEAEAYLMYNGWKNLDRYSPSGEDNFVFATPDGMPSWMTVNLKTSYAINDRLRINLGLENMMNSHYRLFASGISAPGRNLVVAIRAKF